MSLDQIIEALDVLANPKNADVVEYIKSFDGDGGFMYTRETEPRRIELKKKMETIIDERPHSGASWGCMLRAVQASLNGVDGYSYEQIITEKNKIIQNEIIVNREWKKILKEEEERVKEGRGIETRRVILDVGWSNMPQWKQIMIIKCMLKNGELVVEEEKEEGDILSLKESEYESSIAIKK